MASRNIPAVRLHAERTDVGWFLLHGAVGGIVGGIAMSMVEMVGAAMLGMSAFAPIRMIAGIVIGPEAMEASYPLVNALFAGVALHMVLSMMYGIGIALVLMLIPRLDSTRGIAVTATVLGFLLWPINFYIIAPITGWTWFPDETNALHQVIAHAMFGLSVGLYIAVVGGRRTQAP